jgi:HK97 family phage portal protein
VAWLDRFRWGRKSAGTLELLREIYGQGWATKSRRTVNLATAIQVSAVFACARVVGNGIAQVPLKLMRETGNTRLPAVDHPLYALMARKPNPWQTSFEFRQMVSWHVELAGRFVAFKNAPAGTIRELIPFEPGSVEITRRDDLSLKYVVTSPNGSKQEFPEEVIWHVRGPSWNGWSAIDPLKAARDAIGLAIAIEESQAGLHANGVQSAGAWSVEGKLTPDQYKQLRDWIDKEHAGANNAGKSMIMDRAGKWISTQMTGVDAQTLESRRNQVEEVCRFMGVMPIMAGYSDKAATYASAEQMFIAHVVHTLAPRWEMYEQSMDANLLTDKERADGYYFDFVEEGMLRGSVKDTADALLRYVNGGLMTANEGRGKLDLNPDSDPDSDKLRIPVNTVQDPNAADPSADPPQDPNAKAALEAVRMLEAKIDALLSRQPPDIKVDARTTIDKGAIQVTTGATSVKTELQPGAVQLDAPVTVNSTVGPAAPVVKAYASETEEIITRDDKGEIKSIVKRAKE